MTKTALSWSIIIGLLIIPFTPLFVSSALFFPFITTKAFVWRIIVEIIFALWIILVLLDAEYRPKKSALLWAFVAFLVIIGLADAFGVAPLKSFWSNFERMEGFVTLLHLGALFLVMGSVLREREWKWWWNTSLGVSAIIFVYCLFQLGGAAAIHQSGARIDATLGNAAYLAVYMLIHVFVAALYFIRTKRGNFLRWIYGALIIADGVTLYYTATRGAILGLLGGILLIALLNITNREHQRARKGSIAIIAGVVLLVGGFFAVRHASFVKNSPVLGRFASISLAELQTEGRSFIWPMALEGIKERPLLGWGQENFNYVFDEHYSPKMFNLEPWFDRAHNIFLDWGISGGILGLLSYLSLYVLLLWAIWRKDAALSRVEKTVLTGLLAAYFFNNFFVFDNLVSYTLFIALLAYVHSRTAVPLAEPRTVSEQTAYLSAIPVGIVLLLVLWFVNIAPIRTNADLISALKDTQSGGDPSKALADFQAAYNSSRLGRPEVVEWISSSAPNILQSNISTDEKSAYFDFAQSAVEKQAAELPTDARYQLVAGSFLATTGDTDDGLKYLMTAQKLIPGKQEVYFEIASAYLGKQDYADALKVLKQAYDLAPEYQEADVLYLVGAIYAKDTALQAKLAAAIPADVLASDDRVASALYAAGNFNTLISLLKTRLQNASTNPQAYASLSLAYDKAGDKTDAVAVMKSLEQKMPEYKTQAEQYITEIENNSL